MSIYITQKTKEELEAKVAEFETYEHTIDDIEGFSDIDCFDIGKRNGQISILKKILSEAIVLTVEESWDDVLSSTEKTDCLYSCEVNFPNGVIIKSK